MGSSLLKSSVASSDRILGAVKKYWGFDSLRPLQEEAIRAGVEHRDSLVVMPTGGGKSLCYQVPPLVASRTDIVVSPLISLMKDQVDALRTNGYPAAAIHSGLTDTERREIHRGIADRTFRLVFVAPERLLLPTFLNYIKPLQVNAFAIDEAHCISQWGHDFRPEYRRLATLKEHFPTASLHAYTATATPRVQQDIVKQLSLRDPNVLIGTFDRPNLVYRVVPKVQVEAQTLEVIRRHMNEAVIVYCISRKDTEYLAEVLKANGVKAAAYHAGMGKEIRTKTQDAFAAEEIDVVVATVAFGMGIDRSNVRCVIHAAMPKTVEHYQQETGRAGRDGLEAECVVFYSGGDVLKWRRLIDFSAESIEDESLRAQVVAAQRDLLEHMAGLCVSARCRHKALSEYFGQAYERASCGACDLCLGEIESMSDSTVIAQKILSCVARVEQRFGVGHIVDVLTGADTEFVRQCRHDELSTFGLLSDMTKPAVRNLIFQLVDLGVLERTGGDRPVLKLNDASKQVLRRSRDVRLIEPKSASVRRTKVEAEAWEGVDRGLFEHLRAWRKQVAAERGVPAFVIFADSTLRELAAVRPSDANGLSRVGGIGKQKRGDFGSALLDEIRTYCSANALPQDEHRHASMVMPPKQRKPNPQKDNAFAMFRRRCPVEETAEATGRAPGTLWGYLEEFIRAEQPERIDAWVNDAVASRVLHAATSFETGHLKPIFESLNQEIPYEAIRIVLAHAETKMHAATDTSESTTSH